MLKPISQAFRNEPVKNQPKFQQKQQHRCKPVTPPIHPMADQEETIYSACPGLTIKTMVHLSS